jgi:hypothetical protein
MCGAIAELADEFWLWAAWHVAVRLADALQLPLVRIIPVLLAELGAITWDLRVFAAGNLAGLSRITA